MGKTKELSKYTRDQIIKLHKTGFGYQKLSQKVGEKLITLGAIVHKSKT